MTEIRFAIDLDGVLTEHPAPLARAANDRFGLELVDDAFIDSAGYNVPQQVKHWVYSSNGPASLLKPAPTARTFLNALVNRLGSTNVIILTARPENSANMTAAWLRENKLDHCNVVYAEDKVAVARRHSVTHAVEDSIRHALAYQAAGIVCYLLIQTSAPDVREIQTPVSSLTDVIDQLPPPDGDAS